MKPTIAITMGDPAGIGPEIILKALTHQNIRQICRPLVIGDAKILERAEQILSTGQRIRRVQDPANADFQDDTINCLDLDVTPQTLPFGQVSAIAGKAAFLFVERAIQLAQAGLIQAICTAPLNKTSLNLAGYPYPGHTEILVELTGAQHYAMMLTAPQLRVIHVTTHQGLIQAIQSITTERVYQVIRLAHETLQKAGFSRPKIAISAINPHSGEQGLFGEGEEGEKIIPAIKRARQRGMSVSEPIPADTVFLRALRGEYDIVVAMYHDQGHIPIKLLGFEQGVNITVGLPFVRTSVDHGTAFDLAGKGLASEQSMCQAIIQAVELVGSSA